MPTGCGRGFRSQRRRRSPALPSRVNGNARLFLSILQRLPFTAGSSESVTCDGWVREVVFERLRESACAPPDETGLRPSTCTANGRLRMYESVTHAERPGGPFSFVPCRPFGVGGGFSRPAVHLRRGLIEPNLRMGAKATEASASELASIWELVRDQVADAGLALGVRMDVPPHVAGPAS